MLQHEKTCVTLTFSREANFQYPYLKFSELISIFLLSMTTNLIGKNKILRTLSPKVPVINQLL